MMVSTAPNEAPSLRLGLSEGVLVWPRMGLRVPGCWSYFPAVRTDGAETN